MFCCIVFEHAIAINSNLFVSAAYEGSFNFEKK